MGGSVASFRPNGFLTAGALGRLTAGLTGDVASPPADPAARVSITRLDAALVRASGLRASAAALARGARAAGLAPPSRFGTEAAARLLGLRYNHPAAEDVLELLPADHATRAEAAYSAARILTLSTGEVERIEELAREFTLPPLTVWQRRILTTAVRFIGYPYVWGGTSESSSELFGVSVRGGFDCSGFVWRVYKLEPYRGATRLARVLRGRTTFELSGEVRRARRLPFAQLEPADLVFFGANGPRSKPGQINHMGIYVGEGWMIHSSGQGVALAPLTGWYRQRFAWARRPLAEAGLQ
jgi:cell wall-associated NlpC family hydrolase